jgi:hypothetical protein
MTTFDMPVAWVEQRQLSATVLIADALKEKFSAYPRFLDFWGCAGVVANVRLAYPG